MSRDTRRTVGGYPSSGRPASDLAPPPRGAAPGARRCAAITHFIIDRLLATDERVTIGLKIAAAEQLEELQGEVALLRTVIHEAHKRIDHHDRLGRGRHWWFTDNACLTAEQAEAVERAVQESAPGDAV